ncbi:uncharacterized protein LOC123407281 [Hordeum vulgare subsp. vulgare]|uniref:uncharacterized protein LOC123407281 n=1 Tax=Hordeum vulgare subsp. vulgare TaxID=112509 RepID=UPI001D1A4AD6|nr:uncharacterized protein LOC123407281 [Hordeum vulgare subsp. vulgare]
MAHPPLLTRTARRRRLWVFSVESPTHPDRACSAPPSRTSPRPPPPTHRRRRRHGGRRRGVRGRRGDLREDHPRGGVRGLDRLLRPPEQPPRHPGGRGQGGEGRAAEREGAQGQLHPGVLRRRQVRRPARPGWLCARPLRHPRQGGCRPQCSRIYLLFLARQGAMAKYGYCPYDLDTRN